MEGVPILQVRNLSIFLQLEEGVHRVVKNLDFSLYKGKTLALVGESGCGKTMSALSILGILPKPPMHSIEGEIVYRGQNLLTLSDKQMQKIRGRKIAMIFQDPMNALNPVYTIGEQLLEVLAVHLQLEGKAAEKRALEALRSVHLPDPKCHMHQYPHELSGGMLQRVMIAMALLCAPDILIADEPTTALDVTIQGQILSLLQELGRKEELAILLITHDMNVVAKMADKVAVMYATEVVELGEKNNLMAAPAHPYTVGLFRSRPSRPLREGPLPTIKGSVPPITSLPTGCHFHPRCPLAKQVCRSGEVPLLTPQDKTHEVRCLRYQEDFDAPSP